MTVDYRPVDCDTDQVLPISPGFVSRVVYDDDIRPGWNWFPYSRVYAELIQGGKIRRAGGLKDLVDCGV